MKNNPVDFSFLYEVSGMEGQYICDVIDIFFSVMPDGLKKLHDLVTNTENWDAIHRQAHFLKSSVSIIKVQGMYELFYYLEKKGNDTDKAIIAGEKKDIPAVKADMAETMTQLYDLYNMAAPFITAEKDKYKAK